MLNNLVPVAAAPQGTAQKCAAPCDTDHLWHSGRLVRCTSGCPWSATPPVRGDGPHGCAHCAGCSMDRFPRSRCTPPCEQTKELGNLSLSAGRSPATTNPCSRRLGGRQRFPNNSSSRSKPSTWIKRRVQGAVRALLSPTGFELLTTSDLHHYFSCCCVCLFCFPLLSPLSPCLLHRRGRPASRRICVRVITFLPSLARRRIHVNPLCK